LTDARAALELATTWEEDARQQRLAQGGGTRKPTIRVRAGSAERQVGLLTQAEVAAILRISQRAVREIERRAFHKLRKHPALKTFWREWQTGEVEEAVGAVSCYGALTGAERAALYALVRTRPERQTLRKLLRLTDPH